MCRRCWVKVPPRLRQRIWGSYRVGQCEDKNPSKEYLIIARAAVIAVASADEIAPDTRLYDHMLAKFGVEPYKPNPTPTTIDAPSESTIST